MIAVLDSPAAPSSAPPQKSGGRTKAELLATVSASRLGTWLGCRLKFYFRYVLGIVKPTTPARHVGTVVHAVLQAWSLARWRRAPLDPEMVEATFSQAWTPAPDEPVKWDEDEPEATVRTAARGLIDAYLRQTPIPEAERPEAVEVSVEKDLRAHGLPKLIGVIDLVRAGGRIVDFKTGARTPTPEMALHGNDVQLTAYSLMYREATGRTESALELHHIIKTKVPKVIITESAPVTEVQTTRFFRLVESYVRGLEADDIVPSPGLACASCEFFNECRRWH